MDVADIVAVRHRRQLVAPTMAVRVRGQAGVTVAVYGASADGGVSVQVLVTRQPSVSFSADLTRADLTGARLYSANLLDADLTGANLSGADLSSVQNLTREQVDSTRTDKTTKLTPGL
ncbi:pentapeptide repeat-containing protein [Streptomyces sp. NPDC055025]